MALALGVLVRWQLPPLLSSAEELDLGCRSTLAPSRATLPPDWPQQQSANQEYHVKSKGNSSNHHIQLRIFRAASIPDPGAGKGVRGYT